MLKRVFHLLAAFEGFRNFCGQGVESVVCTSQATADTVKRVWLFLWSFS